MEDKKTERQASRQHWNLTNQEPNIEELKAGNLARIADACELMAKDRQTLIFQRDSYKSSSEYWREEYFKLERKNTALRGWITRLKNINTSN